MTEYEIWREEMARRRLKLAKARRKVERRKAVDELPTLAQRVLGRIILAFT